MEVNPAGEIMNDLCRVLIDHEAYHRALEKAEDNYDPEQAVLEMWRQLTWGQLMEALESCPDAQGEALLSHLRVSTLEHRAAGAVLTDIVESYIRSECG